MNFKMNSKENGLTVGELTIAISVLILTGLIWTNISKKDNSNQISTNSNPQTIEKIRYLSF